MVAIRVLTACLLWSATCLAASAAAPHVLSDAPRFAPAASASDVMKGASETDVNEVMSLWKKGMRGCGVLWREVACGVVTARRRVTCMFRIGPAQGRTLCGEVWSSPSTARS